LAEALAMERRLVAKRRTQSRAGAGPRAFDWCDGLYGLAARAGPPATPGACGAVAAAEPAGVLVVRLGRLVVGVVVTDTGARADPGRPAGPSRPPLGAGRAGVARAPAAALHRGRGTAGRIGGGDGARLTAHS